MATWVKLHDKSGNDLWVNMDAAGWMYPRTGGARICFPTGAKEEDAERVDVAESPDDIAVLVRKAKS